MMDLFKPATRDMIGTRIGMHPARDEWMQGDRYGEIVGIGHKREYSDSFTGLRHSTRPYIVKLDKSGRKVRVHPTEFTTVD